MTEINYSDQWMFDATVIPVGVQSADRRKIEGQVRVALPLPLTAQFKGRSEVVGVGIEARRQPNNPWVTVSGRILMPEAFEDLRDGAHFGIGGDCIDPTYTRYDGDVLVAANPSLVAIRVYLGEDGNTPAFEGASLRLLAPLSAL